MNQVEFRGMHRIRLGFTESQFSRRIPAADAVWGASLGPWALLGRPRGRLGLSRTLVFHWFYKGFPGVEALWGRGGVRLMLFTEFAANSLNSHASVGIHADFVEFT